MSAPTDSSLVALTQVRERTIAILTDNFAHDVLSIEEFEERLTVAHTAENAAEIEALVKDLPGATPSTTPTTPPKEAQTLVPIERAPYSQATLAVFGGSRRTGQWVCPRHLHVFVLMGGTELDFREARLPPGVIEVNILAAMGGVEIIVPPGLAVEAYGAAIMGGFEEIARAPIHPDPNAPLLRVRGFVMMGGVHISTRLPGESERDARRRKRRERKAQRKLLR